MSERVAHDEEIEGLDSPDSEPFQDYPLDKLHIRQETRTVQDVIRRIKQNRYVMDPDFQRDFIWDVRRQSRLIESVLMRIPLPVFYLAEDEQGRLIVVDGLQRLTTFARYLSNEFALNLANKQLYGKRFDDLLPKLKNRLEDAQLILYVIDEAVPDQAKFDIFERVNGGVPLTRQQMRNCLYQGQATRWLRTEAESVTFIEATGGSLRSETMRDREVINRFCSFYLLGYKKHKGNTDAFLADGLKRMNRLPDDELERLQHRLQRGLKNNMRVFGKHAFRKRWRGKERRSRFNVALFDAFSVLLGKRQSTKVERHADELLEGYFDLMDDTDFVTAISNATDSPRRIRVRFDMAKEMIAGVLDAE